MHQTIKYGCCILLLLSLAIGCSTRHAISPGSNVPPATSLLLIPPYIAGESTIRNPPPLPSRLCVKGESVEGWFNPVENMLRFPIDLKANPRFSVRFSGASENATPGTDLRLKAEFVPLTDGDNVSIGNSNIYTVFEISPAEGWTESWYNLDVRMEDIPAGPGEIRLVAEGSIVDDPSVDIFWGQPVVHYPDERRKQNVLLIGIDTLRSDGLEQYGARSGVSPALQRLSESATLFTQARAQSSWTAPSFTSMLTGLYPSQVNPTISLCLPPIRVDTLPEMLLSRGFTTMTICGNPHIGRKSSGFHQGNETLWYSYNASPNDSVVMLRRFIERSPDRDWFCFLHIMDPHTPYEPPSDYIDRFCEPEYEGEIGTKFDLQSEWQFLSSPPPSDDIRRARELYDSEIANLDKNLENLFAWMTQTGIMDDTLVIFSSDHGEEFFDHGRFDHGQSVYDEQVHVPLIVKGKGFTEGLIVDKQVGNIDIVPTILKSLGLPVPERLPGKPLQNIINDADLGNRIVFGECTLLRGISHQKFAVEWPNKCTLDFFTGESRLYNLKDDPAELNDISAEFPDIVQSLSDKMINTLLPIRTMYAIVFAGKSDGNRHVFNGTLELTGGIEHAHVLRSTEVDPADQTVPDGNSLHFEVVIHEGQFDVMKGYVIHPVDSNGDFNADLQYDGDSSFVRFFPYGDSKMEPSGVVSAGISDFNWPAQVPVDFINSELACYIIGIPAMTDEMILYESGPEMDPETAEQLRALGYLH